MSLESTVGPAAKLTDAAIDFTAIKQRQQAAWASGDFAVIGVTLQIVGESLAEAADVRAGERVLDVAAGNGNATLAAARRFAQVTSTDYVPHLLDKDAERGKAEGLDVRFQTADAENLPFADGSFVMKLSKPPFRLENPIRNSSRGIAVFYSLIALLAAGCASSSLAPPEVPATLRPPQDQSLFLEARATGVQIYECAAKPGDSSGFAWVFKAPEATLADRWGRPIGKHYAGPTWESSDGSTVVGELASRDPGPEPSAIPWLLLTAKSTSGAGDLAGTRSIQRVHTTGGVAPAQPCASRNAKQTVRVPYTATYYFYRAMS